MNNGIADRIELLLKEKGIKQKDLCEQITICCHICGQMDVGNLPPIIFFPSPLD